MIHFTLMPASISITPDISSHCAPALPASTSPNTRARSHKLVFASALLLGVLADRLLRVPCHPRQLHRAAR